MEKLDVGSKMKFGSRWHKKAKQETEEKLLTHIVNTIKLNAKRGEKLAKGTAATRTAKTKLLQEVAEGPTPREWPR